MRGCVTFGLPKGKKGSSTLWLDAAQLERGATASPYHPRAELEAGIETGVVGNLFTDPANGLSFRFRAINASKEPQKLNGRLRVTDFWDRTVWEERPGLEVAPSGGSTR